MIPPERFETERLILRKPRMEDASAIFEEYAQDVEVTRYMVWRPHKSEGETRYIVNLMLELWKKGSDYSFAITRKENDRVIGMIAMHPAGFKVGIGYVLARSCWGMGYMTEAAETIVKWLLAQPDIYRVFATCDVENPASARILEKVGMIREGLLRKYIIHPNISDIPRDSYMYAIVK